MYITRKLEATILKYLDTKEILAIVGPRQAGKTTLLKQIQSHLTRAVFLTFEDREELELFEQDIKNFAKKYSNYKYIFIDEFQYSKSGGKNLKFLYDICPELKIIISGSSAVDLTIQAIKFLVGRVFVFHLYQLDFEEYVGFKDVGLFNLYKEFKNDFNLITAEINQLTVSIPVSKQFNRILEEFIIWGGYPRVILSETTEEKKLVIKNIYNTYFLRDIRDTLGLIDDFKLSKLIKALAIQIGQLVEYNELRTISDYDYLSLKKYLNVLEKTFIAQAIKPFFKNKRNEIIKNPKVYFFDTGLRNYIINDFNILENRIDRGFLYENFIFNQLLKQEIIPNFWRTKSKAEVDFVVNIDNSIIPIESKTTVNKIQLTKSYGSFIEQYKPAKGIFLNNAIFQHKKYDRTDVYFLPHWII